MSKTITLRLSEVEYEAIAKSAKADHRPISNFITATVVREIESSYHVDRVEMDQIRKDKGLLERLAEGHKDAKKLRGKIVE
jgi:uncharacterized protein (DUF1778 family)